MAVRAPEYAGFWLGRGAHGRFAALQDAGVAVPGAGPPGGPGTAPDGFHWPGPAPAPQRSRLAEAERVARAGRAWVALGSALVGLVFQVLVLGVAAFGLWHLVGAVAAGRDALQGGEQSAREAGRALDAFLSSLSASALAALGGGVVVLLLAVVLALRGGPGFGGAADAGDSRRPGAETVQPATQPPPGVWPGGTDWLRGVGAGGGGYSGRAATSARGPFGGGGYSGTGARGT